MVIPPAPQMARAEDRLRSCCVSIGQRVEGVIGGPFCFGGHSLCRKPDPSRWDRDGAFANECRWHRVGADTVARDGAGGVEGLDRWPVGMAHPASTLI